jgi:hypothetical protein
MIYRLLMLFGILTCREDEIRTHDAVTHILPFQGSPFNHSGTSLFQNDFPAHLQRG